MDAPAWLKFSVEFTDESGSDWDTVAVALEGLEGCGIRVDGTPMKYCRLEGRALVGYAVEENGEVTHDLIRCALKNDTTITVI